LYRRTVSGSLQKGVRVGPRTRFLLVVQTLFVGIAIGLVIDALPNRPLNNPVGYLAILFAVIAGALSLLRLRYIRLHK